MTLAWKLFRCIWHLLQTSWGLQCADHSLRLEWKNTTATFASDSWICHQCQSRASHHNFIAPKYFTIILFIVIRSSGRQLRFSLTQHWQDDCLVEVTESQIDFVRVEGASPWWEAAPESNSNMIGNVWETITSTISPFPGISTTSQLHVPSLTSCPYMPIKFLHPSVHLEPYTWQLVSSHCFCACSTYSPAQ
jgi:hypothetical protein